MARSTIERPLEPKSSSLGESNMQYLIEHVHSNQHKTTKQPKIIQQSLFLTLNLKKKKKNTLKFYLKFPFLEFHHQPKTKIFKNE